MPTPGFAIFETVGGIVNVDNSNGNAAVTGMQFATDGYILSGNAIELVGADGKSVIRVGDGTAAGANYTVDIGNFLTGSSALYKTGTGKLVLTSPSVGNTYSGGTVIQAGTLSVGYDGNLGAAGTTVTLDGGTLEVDDGFSSNRPFVLDADAGNGGITIGSSASATLTGTVSGTGSLLKFGNGTLTLTGANSSAGTSVRDGKVVGNAGSLGGSVGVSSGATVVFKQSTNATYAGRFSGQGSAVKQGTGNLTLSGQSPGTLDWTIQQGSLIVQPDLFHSNVDITAAGQLAFKQATDGSYGGQLTGDGQFTKQGTGVVQLTGDNSAFAGSTLVSGGGITVDDTLGGTVNVASGASLGGAGTVGGETTIADGGILLGDQQAGPLTMHGLVLNNGSLVNVSLGGPGNTTGLFNVQGDLTLDGTLNVTDEGGFGEGVYRLMDYTGTLTGNGMDIGTVPGGFSAAGMAIQTSVANEVNLMTTSGDVQFWDGDATGNAGNGKIDGGDGTWTTQSTNWTTADGSVNNTMNPVPGFAIFEATPGTVTVDDGKGNVTVTGMQFASDGYVVQGAPITLVPDAAGDDIALRVGDGTQAGAGDTATIASNLANTSGHVTKTDLGTLVLTGSSTMSNVSLHGGTTRLASGGTLQADQFSVADVAGDDALLDVTDKGSTLNISTTGIDSLFIGYHGTGKLVVEKGAVVRNLGGTGFRTSSYIGSNTDGQGTVVVTGAGSLWDAGSLAVGDGNRGSLLIEDGGTVSHGGSNPAVNVGLGKGSVGQVTVTGKGSAWNIPTGTTIGNQGAGTLTIADGGAVNATGSGTSLNIAYATGSTGTLNIGAAAGDAAAAAGTLNVASVTFGDGTGTLVFNHTGGDTFATTLSGTGSVRQMAGTTIMNGDSGAFDGTVSVQGGTLIVGDDGHAGAALGGPVDVASGATLGGFGTIGSLDLSGTLSPGDSIGTLHVTGSAVFEKGSTFDVEITPAGKADTLNVGGKATINGGTVDAIKAAGHYTGDTRYTLVEADKGVSGTFDTLTQNMPFLNLVLGYDPDHVYLSVQRNAVAFCTVADTGNQCATGNGVESTGVGTSVYDTIAGLPDPATVRVALDELSGEFHASQESARIDDSRFVREAMDQRLREGAADAEADRVPGTRLTAWAHAWGHWGTIDGDGNAAKLSDNGDGLLIGADLPVGKTGRVGVTGGASRNSLSVRNRNAWARTTSQWLGAFGGFTQGPFAFRAGAAYAWDKIPAYREVHLPGFSERLSSNATGSTVTGYVEGAWKFQLARATIAPYLNLANVHVDTDAATETGGTAALHMDSEDMETSLGTLGVRGNWRLAHRVSLHADLGWQHAFGDITPARTQRFANGSAFTVYGVPLAKSAGIAKLGVNWRITPRTTFTAGYEGLWGDGVQDTAAKASLQVKF